MGCGLARSSVVASCTGSFSEHHYAGRARPDRDPSPPPGQRGRRSRCTHPSHQRFSSEPRSFLPAIGRSAPACASAWHSAIEQIDVLPLTAHTSEPRCLKSSTTGPAALLNGRASNAARAKPADLPQCRRGHAGPRPRITSDRSNREIRGGYAHHRTFARHHRTRPHRRAGRRRVPLSTLRLRVRRIHHGGLPQYRSARTK